MEDSGNDHLQMKTKGLRDEMCETLSIAAELQSCTASETIHEMPFSAPFFFPVLLCLFWVFRFPFKFCFALERRLQGHRVDAVGVGWGDGWDRDARCANHKE